MDNLVVEALKFMVLGMGIVYLLLALIVILVGIQHKIVEKYFPDKPQTPQPVASNKNTTQANEDEEVIAAIVAAVSKYKQN